jgi:hypothetical protein
MTPILGIMASQISGHLTPATNYESIATVTVSTAVSSITFSSIPATYKDLLLSYSVRGNNADSIRGLRLSVNGSTANLSVRHIQGLGSGTPGSYTGTNDIGAGNTAGSTSNTFTSAQIYFSNYTSSSNKPFSGETTSEANTTFAAIQVYAGLFSSSSAISSLGISFDADNMVTNSTFYLYGINNS